MVVLLLLLVHLELIKLLLLLVLELLLLLLLLHLLGLIVLHLLGLVVLHLISKGILRFLLLVVRNWELWLLIVTSIIELVTSSVLNGFRNILILLDLVCIAVKEVIHQSLILSWSSSIVHISNGLFESWHARLHWQVLLVLVIVNLWLV